MMGSPWLKITVGHKNLNIESVFRKDRVWIRVW